MAKSRSRVLTDHEAIRGWATDRGGRACDDPVIRSCAAAGLLAAVLDALNSGVPRIVAAETSKEAPAELEALPS
ncbi:hypothetical protein [Bosea sp. Leaf344]|uniref:hypothetical protein n=1 Tax=Bosea sp. Leaf344 TaxID=1736346 RepID=UPI000B196264|nr:hypothetical protein [Bosea sp. Leaf344]